MIPGWTHIGKPPQLEKERYDLLWHVELVLRHFVYGVARTSLGPKQIDLLGNAKGVDEAKRWRDKAIAKNEFAADRIPSLYWFASFPKLMEVIYCDKNWDAYFRSIFDPSSRDETEAALEPLGAIRNRWAHFRPNRASHDEEFAKSVEFLSKPLWRWIARYCDADPIDATHPLAEAYRNANPGGVPLGFRGQGGFADPDADRGVEMLIEANEAKDCYIVTPRSVGINDEYLLSDAIDLSVRLRELAVHILWNYYPVVAATEQEDFPLIQVRATFARSDEDANCVKGLKEISAWLAGRKTRPVSWSPGGRPLTLDRVTAALFYDSPWNVLVNPTQNATSTSTVSLAPDS